LAAALPDLEKASALGRNSVLDPYFRGLVAERRGMLDDAFAAYNRAMSFSVESYPAIVGAARVMAAQGKASESVALLTELLVRYPDNLLAKRELALAYYKPKDWPRASNAVSKCCSGTPKDSRLPHRAHILTEQAPSPKRSRFLTQRRGGREQPPVPLPAGPGSGRGLQEQGFGA
jgi:tetratricopeptide (TPR) repeat protein